MYVYLLVQLYNIRLYNTIGKKTKTPRGGYWESYYIISKKLLVRVHARMRPCGPRRSGFFYRPFLSRFYVIQFYGFRVRIRAVRDSCCIFRGACEDRMHD